MKYINKVTGIVIDVDSKISGGDWKKVREKTDKEKTADGPEAGSAADESETDE